MSEPYLPELAVRLANGLARLPTADRARHAAYLRAAQNADGGFSGREGGSDLYYTGFGLRGLAALDALTPEACERAAAFLRGCLTGHTNVIDFFSLLFAALLVQTGGGPDVFADSPPGWDERVARVLETFRTPDGGYSRVAGSKAGSTYHTFLVGLCYQLLGRSYPEPRALVDFIHSRQREDGGFVEIGPMRRAGTNPTAAAVGALQMIDGVGAARAGVVRFLTAMSTDDGFQANSRAPLTDLLSTFTGLWTLDQLDALAGINQSGTLSFVQRLEFPGGGFRAGLWDDRTDVEYTFYGLGVLALLS